MQVSEKVAYAKSHSIKGSVQKVCLVSRLVCRMRAEDALLQLSFSKKRVAKDMYDVLNSAIFNAQNNFGMDVEKLYISEVKVGKAFAMKRFHARGRGRASKISKPYSKIAIYLKERD